VRLCRRSRGLAWQGNFETLGVGRQKSADCLCGGALELGASGNELLGSLNRRLPPLAQLALGRVSLIKAPSLLAGVLVDARGERLTPSHAVKNCRRDRYYVSGTLNRQAGADRAQGRRLAAEEIEDAGSGSWPTR
jgi:hypothetical protein